MTQSEFIKSYCEKSGITEKELNELGQFAIICNCGDRDCRGWAMIGKETLKFHIELDINGSYI